MLFNTKQANKEITEMIKNWKKKRLAKLNCNKCPYKDEAQTVCQACKDEIADLPDGVKQMEIQYDCDDCGMRWREMMEQDCEECAEGLTGRTRTSAY